VVDALITVGPRARIIGLEALDFGMAGDRVQMVDDAPDAVPLLEELIRPGDTVLVKGSLGMRMDRLVTALGRHD
jgi:UDP-N-acetylmuramoyl-tripeptide--D-alanyl-D-alanine ligase